MKNLIQTVVFLISCLTTSYSQNNSQFYSETKKISYIIGYSSINLKKYNTENINYNNSSVINLGIDYRFMEKKNYQFTLGSILSYNNIQYRIDNNFTETGTELFLELPIKFEYNIAIGDNIFLTPTIGINTSRFLNSENRYYQNYYFEGGNYETSISTTTYSLSGIGNISLNYKTNKGIFGFNIGYNTTLNNVYKINHTDHKNNTNISQNLKRKFVNIGLKFTPKK